MGGLHPILDLQALNHTLSIRKIGSSRLSVWLKGVSERELDIKMSFWFTWDVWVRDWISRRVFSHWVRGQFFLGVVWDSTSMQVQLSPAQIKSLFVTLKDFRLGWEFLSVNWSYGSHHQHDTFGASATISVVAQKSQLKISVTCRSLCSPSVWKEPWFLSLGPTLGASRW